MTLICAICLYLEGEAAEAVTIADGMAVCEPHLFAVSTEPAMIARQIRENR